MKIYVLLSNISIKISPIVHLYIIRNVFSMNLVEKSLKEDTPRIGSYKEIDERQIKMTKDQFDKMNLVNFEANNVVSTTEQPNSQYKTSKEMKNVFKNDDLNMLFSGQKKLITEIKNIFNRTRENSNWNDIEEHLEFNILYKNFVALSKNICEYISLSQTVIINRFDHTIISIEEHMNKFDEIKTSLKDDIRKTRSNLLLKLFLKRTLANAINFYSKINQRYQIELIKYGKICGSICRFKVSFSNAILHMEDIEKIVLTSTFNFVQKKILILFNFFDENSNNSFIKVNESIKGLSISYLEKLIDINKEMYYFFSAKKLE